MTEKAKFDLVVYGATSFVGAITAEYILSKYGIGGDVSWAIAARSPAKLAALKEKLGEGAADLPTLIANSDEEASLADVCAQTRSLSPPSVHTRFMEKSWSRFARPVAPTIATLQARFSGFPRCWISMARLRAKAGR